jgi:ribose 1,5-bisphosphate isomerase|tara:strand:- start:3628 stop:4470 length:843 start_codon:yes stop_codon:yes gene_type:complete
MFSVLRIYIKMKNKKKRFNQIVKDIKEIKIQGATNIAKSALQAYFLIPTKSSKKKLISLRPTEPLLVNILNKKQPYNEILKHFSNTLEKINKSVLKLIKSNEVIFTHCHSTSVVNALIYSKKKKKKFEVYNTETRPLYQGRKTARELKKAKIKVTMFVDSAAMIALTKSQGTKKVDKVFLGADALLKNGVINKVGSAMFAKIAYENKIPVYVLSDSWKFSSKNIKIEERDFHEVWKKLPKNSKIKIRNPAFEFVPKKYITKIVSEFGVLSYNDFLKKVKN